MTPACAACTRTLTPGAWLGTNVIFLAVRILAAPAGEGGTENQTGPCTHDGDHPGDHHP